MPLRAFLLFGLALWFCASASAKAGFNALAGIFAFRTLLFRRRRHYIIGFNALAGIFAFRTDNATVEVRVDISVSMPLRAFLLFGLGRIY